MIIHLARLLRTGLLAAPLVATLSLSSGCQYPAPQSVEPVRDSPVHAAAVQQLLLEAPRKQVWTADDESAFRQNLKHLSPETRFAAATRLAVLINSKAVHFDRSPSKTPQPPTCPCTPGLCDAVPAPVPPPTTSGPASPAAPATKAK